LARASANTCAYCCRAEFSSVSAETSLRKPEEEPTSTWASTPVAAAPPAANKKARLARQRGDETLPDMGSVEGVLRLQIKHMVYK
jgi:hypothetical protein